MPGLKPRLPTAEYLSEGFDESRTQRRCRDAHCGEFAAKRALEGRFAGPGVHRLCARERRTIGCFLRTQSEIPGPVAIVPPALPGKPPAWRKAMALIFDTRQVACFQAATFRDKWRGFFSAIWRFNNLCFCTSTRFGPESARIPRKQVAKLWCQIYGA